MKVRGIILSIAIFAVIGCNQAEISSEERTSSSVASISQQIEGINATLNLLKASQKDLELQINTVNPDDEATRRRLESMNVTLQSNISDLETYLSEDLKKSRDWEQASYATLSRYRKLCGEMVELSDKGFNVLERMKNWVNVQFDGYGTIAQLELKLSSLQYLMEKSQESDESVASEMKEELQSQSQALTTGYERVISAAIKENKGKISSQMSAVIRNETEVVLSQTESISERIDALEARFAALESAVSALMESVQSIAVVPDYSDGSVKMEIAESTPIRFEVYPLEAARKLVASGSISFSLDYVLTETKSSMFHNIPITDVSFDEEIVTVIADGSNISKSVKDGLYSANARLRISNDKVTRCSSFFGMQYKYGGRKVSWQNLLQAIKSLYATWKEECTIPATVQVGDEKLSFSEFLVAEAQMLTVLVEGKTAASVDVPSYTAPSNPDLDSYKPGNIMVKDGPVDIQGNKEDIFTIASRLLIDAKSKGAIPSQVNIFLASGTEAFCTNRAFVTIARTIAAYANTGSLPESVDVGYFNINHFLDHSLKSWAQGFVQYPDVWENTIADVLDADGTRYTGSELGPWENVHFIPIPQDTPYNYGSWTSLNGKNQWDSKYQPYKTVKVGDTEFSAAQCWEIGIRGLMDMCTKEGNTFIDRMRTRNDIPTYQDNKSLMNAPINRPNENCIWGLYPWFEGKDQVTLAGIHVTEVDVEFLLRCGTYQVARAFLNSFGQAFGKIGNYAEFGESEGTIMHTDAEGNPYIGLICPMRELLIMARIYKYLLDNNISSNVYSAIKDVKFDYDLYKVPQFSLTSLSLLEGRTSPLTAILIAGNVKSLTFTSSDTSVATVDANGNVTAVSKGTATIKATLKDGSGNFAECSVSVYKNYAGAVDLGLPSGLKWAASNLSETGLCSNHWDYGDYYAWGETEPYYSSQSPLVWKSGKTGYNWSSYKWCKGSEITLTKYCSSDKTSYWAGSGSPDNKRVLDSEDDVACVKLGGKWRMPTDEEWGELIDKCTWKWVDNYNGTGVNGRLVTGPNGNSIFLPAAGYRYDTYPDYVGSYGFFWSSSLSAVYPYSAWRVYFISGTVYRNYGDRCCGRSVRPVSE